MPEKAPKLDHHSFRANNSLNFFRIFFTQNSSYPFFPFLIFLFMVILHGLSKFNQIPTFFSSFIFIQLLPYFFFDFSKCYMSFFTSNQMANFSFSLAHLLHKLFLYSCGFLLFRISTVGRRFSMHLILKSRTWFASEF